MLNTECVRNWIYSSLHEHLVVPFNSFPFLICFASFSCTSIGAWRWIRTNFKPIMTRNLNMISVVGTTSTDSRATVLCSVCAIMSVSSTSSASRRVLSERKIRRRVLARLLKQNKVGLCETSGVKVTLSLVQCLCYC